MLLHPPAPKRIYIPPISEIPVIFMGGKKKADTGGDKKTKQKNAQAIDERFKKALAVQPPEDNPFKMENDQKIDRFRFLYKSDWRSIKEIHRHKRRDSRPHKSKHKFF
jgi:hypothetical protein